MEKARPANQKGLRGGGEKTTGTEHREGRSAKALREWGMADNARKGLSSAVHEELRH